METHQNNHSYEDEITRGDKLLGDKLLGNKISNKNIPGNVIPCPVKVVCISDVGQIRENNEDNYYIGAQDGIFIVADGMGGHQSGEAASRMVVDVIPQILKNAVKEATDFPLRYKSILGNSIKELNRLLLEKANAEPLLHGMGSTVAMIWLPDMQGNVYIANLGDSRIYYYHKGNLDQLSLDHSIVNLLVLQGEIKPEEARDHPGRGRLYRYIGMDGDAAAELHDMRLQPDDILLLCSDGLTDHLADFRIQTILVEQPDIKKACKELIDAANKQGGKDNITAMLVKWVGTDPAEAL